MAGINQNGLINPAVIPRDRLPRSCINANVYSQGIIADGEDGSHWVTVDDKGYGDCDGVIWYKTGDLGLGYCDRMTVDDGHQTR